ncbi:protein bric-a-brac 1 [Leptidea sinapis]|uniref:protein bric-a-brac 1 n=1 Tax=Leptidea sinapis TaxID=189913 RepID=UPI0021C28C35|nr:protein bric-a-brac 1 [Leptidea sinapis]
MEDEDLQQFSLRWHNHQSSVVGALARMLSSGALSDVTLSATDGVSLRAHRLVLAACSDYFATIFKEVEGEGGGGGTAVVVECGGRELRALLRFMYTGELLAARTDLPPLLRLARTLHVAPLTEPHVSSTISQTNPVMKDAGTNGQPTTPPPPSPIPSQTIPAPGSERRHISEHPAVDNTKQRKLPQDNGNNTSKTDRLKKLDQIVQNLYSSRLPPAVAETPPNHTSALAQIPPCHTPADRVGGEAQWRERTRRSGPVGSTIGGAVCGVCGKRLSNQYNLRVHLETHDARRHACRACTHVSRSRDALRKHVAYRHAHPSR